jgi:hypothetical protein
LMSIATDMLKVGVDKSWILDFSICAFPSIVKEVCHFARPHARYREELTTFSWWNLPMSLCWLLFVAINETVRIPVANRSNVEEFFPTNGFLRKTHFTHRKIYQVLQPARLCETLAW